MKTYPKTPEQRFEALSEPVRVVLTCNETKTTDEVPRLFAERLHYLFADARILGKKERAPSGARGLANLRDRFAADIRSAAELAVLQTFSNGDIERKECAELLGLPPGESPEERLADLAKEDCERELNGEWHDLAEEIAEKMAFAFFPNFGLDDGTEGKWDDFVQDELPSLFDEIARDVYRATVEALKGIEPTTGKNAEELVEAVFLFNDMTDDAQTGRIAVNINTDPQDAEKMQPFFRAAFQNAGLEIFDDGRDGGEFWFVI